MMIDIALTKVKQAKENYRLDSDFSGKDFDELVASVKEKGVLMPILVRSVGKEYEVIAGNRRYVAATKVGLKTIPAQVLEMDDKQAAEAQIIENLQRKDVHPIEEGLAYRKMIEEWKYDVATIALRVAKSESYVRARLFLTNLDVKAIKMYREGKMHDGHAVLIAKLSSKDQAWAVQEFNEQGFRGMMSVADLKEWIDDHIYASLDNQPWLKSQELLKLVGPCKECPPNNSSLFGEVKEGACTDLACWKRKMKIYSDHVIKEKAATKITDHYGKETGFNALSKSEYTVVAKKGKDRCKFAKPAVFIEGAKMGSEIDICTSKDCKTHKPGSSYQQSPKEIEAAKEARKKQIAKDKAAEVQKEKRLADALAKVKYPLNQNQFEVIVEMVLEYASHDTVMSSAKRHKLEVVKKKTTYGYEPYDYKGAVKKYIDGASNVDKLRLVFELLQGGGYGSPRKGLSNL